MSFDNLLTLTCEVLRRAKTGNDRFGQPHKAPDEFAPVQTLPCRISFAGFSGAQYRPGEIMSERYEDLVREPRIVFLPLEELPGVPADVREADRVRIMDGETEVLPPTDVSSVRLRYGAGNKPHHIELLVETYRTGTEKVNK